MTVVNPIKDDDKCPCGTGREYKDCCQTSDRNTRREDFLQRTGVRIGGSDIYGKKQPVSEIYKILSNIPIAQAILELSSIGIILANTKHRAELDKKLTRDLLDVYQYQRFVNFSKKLSCEYVLFTEKAVTILMQMSRVHCSKDNVYRGKGSYRHQIGRAILLINDLIAEINNYGELDPDLPRIDAINKITPSIIRDAIFRDSDQVRYAIPRASLIFDKFKATVKNKFDFDVIISSMCGFDFKTYFEASYVINGYWDMQTYDEWSSEHVVIDPENVFLNMGASKDRYRKALNYFTQDAIADAPVLPGDNDINGWRCFVYEMYDLRRRPLLKIDGKICCGSKKFLEALWWHAPYYLVMDNSVNKEKDAFFKFLGDSMEEYIYCLTKDALGQKCSRRALRNGTPVNDGVIELATNWLAFIETKAARPTKEMASGNTPLLDMKEFKSKIHYGAKQLADRIREFRSENSYSGRISPCLVTMGFLPLDSVLWELIHSGIQDTGLMVDLNNDPLLISDPLGWEVFCSLVKSGTSVHEIFNKRLSKTDLKTGSFKDYLYIVHCASNEPPHIDLLSLYEDIVEGVMKTFDKGKLNRDTIPGAWKTIFPIP